MSLTPYLRQPVTVAGFALAMSAAFTGPRALAQAPAPPTARQAPTPVPTAAPLPIRRVVLYKSGVGYFEHVGRVTGNQSVSIDFTSAQLDDVLSSLTTLDLNGGRILGVNYNSEDTVDRRLGSLRLPVGEATTRTQFLTALRGAKLETRSAAGVVTGRLLSVEQMQRASGGAVANVDVVTLVSDGGDVRTVALDPGVDIRVLETDLNQEVGRYLSLVASVRDQDVRKLTLSTSGSGDRNLYVSYVSEVPVWKATYRLVLPDAGSARKPLLQGWAIVDNVVGQDWTNVELSLVAGAPQSFIQPISRPYYVQRPVVPLPQRALLTPQTHAGAISTTAQGKSTTNLMEEVTVSEATSGRGAGGGRGGAGFAVGQPAPAYAPPPPPPSAQPLMRDAIAEARVAQQVDASGAQLGDLFEYKLKDAVTIRKNQSALVPILSGDVEAEKVSLWNAAAPSGHPFRAIWLTNATGLTLDGGSFSIVEGQAFAGEGLMESLKPMERRLLSYAVDLGVQVDSKSDPVPSKVSSVQVLRGVLISKTEDRQKRAYTVRNEDTAQRVVVIEHPVRAGWTIEGTTKPVETTSTAYRFKIVVEPKSTASFTVEDIHQGQTSYAVSTITDAQLSVFVRDQQIPASVLAQLKQVLDQKTEIARLNGVVSARQHDIDQIGRDQERVRENMKSLKGSAEERQLLQRYVKQLDDQETALVELRKDVQSATADRDKAQAALAALIAAMGG